MRYGAVILPALCAALLFSCSYLPDSFAVDPAVAVSETRSAITLLLRPAPTRAVGFLFYPGGLVDPHAYLPWLSAVAAAGVPVVLAKAPGNLAVISPDAGLPLRSLVPSATGWIIGGHSLGGAMAAWSIFDHPDSYAGLVLLAAYPSADRSLSAWPHPVLSLSAEHDGLATPAKIAAALPLLPSPQYPVTGPGQYSAATGGYAVLHQIPGGNHAQFGSYGAQDGDGAAAISGDAQHAEMVQYILEFLAANGW